MLGRVRLHCLLSLSVVVVVASVIVVVAVVLVFLVEAVAAVDLVLIVLGLVGFVLWLSLFFSFVFVNLLWLSWSLSSSLLSHWSWASR